MPHDNIKPGQHPVTQDIPLPGFYPCLTLQLNVTTYAAISDGKWVLTVRDPMGQIEVMRGHHEAHDDHAFDHDKLLEAIDQALKSMHYMHRGNNE